MNYQQFIVLLSFIMVTINVTYLTQRKNVALRKRRDALVKALNNVVRYSYDVPEDTLTPRFKNACLDAQKLLTLSEIQKDNK